MWPTLQIFEVYKHHGLSTETNERIGVYAFWFHEDESGVTIQQNIWGRVENTWRIELSDFSSVEKAVKNHWELLISMTKNDFVTANEELQRLVAKSNA